MAERGTLSFDDLCDDVIGVMFEFLPFSLLRKLTLLCSRFYNLIRSRIPHGIKVEKMYNVKNESGIFKLINITKSEKGRLGGITNVKKLRIHYRGPYFPSDKEFTPTFKRHVRQLFFRMYSKCSWIEKIEEIHLHYIEVDEFKDLDFENFPNLTKLRVNFENNMKEISQTISSETLREYRVENVVIPNFPHSFIGCPNLEKIICENTHMKMAKFLSFELPESVLKNVTVVKFLRMRECKYDVYSLVSRCFPNIEIFVFNSSSSGGIPGMKSEWNKLSNLRILRIGNFSLSTGYRQISSTSPTVNRIMNDVIFNKCPNLEELSIQTPNEHLPFFDLDNEKQFPVNLSHLEFPNFGRIGVNRVSSIRNLTTIVKPEHVSNKDVLKLSNLVELKLQSGTKNKIFWKHVLGSCRKLRKIHYQGGRTVGKIDFPGKFDASMIKITNLNDLRLYSVNVPNLVLRTLLLKNSKLERLTLSFVRTAMKSLLVKSIRLKYLKVEDMDITLLKLSNAKRLIELDIRSCNMLKKICLPIAQLLQKIDFKRSSYAEITKIFTPEFVQGLMKCQEGKKKLEINIEQHYGCESEQKYFSDLEKETLNLWVYYKTKKMRKTKIKNPNHCSHKNQKEEHWSAGAPTGSCCWGRKWICLDCEKEVRDVQDGYNS